MSYTVVWKSAAEEELARLWTGSGNRSFVAKAADEIDRLLKTDPLQQGESRSGATRVLFVDPLGVFFHVDEQDRRVAILKVWSVA